MSPVQIDSLKCNICLRNFYTKFMFKIHKKSAHVTLRTIKQEQQQQQQLKQEPLQQQQLHQQLKQEPQQLQNQEQDLKPDKKSRTARKVKKKLITKENKTQCHICKKFISTSYLKTHIASMHEKLEPYQCQICHHLYRYKSTLRIHIETVHEKLKRFKCDPCQGSFRYRNVFRDHRKTCRKALIKTENFD